MYDTKGVEREREREREMGGGGPAMGNEANFDLEVLDSY